MTGVRTRVVRGAVAGAVGTLALDATTHLDMAVRKRPASSTPEQSVEAIASRLHMSLPQDPESRRARLTGLGSVLGIGAGVSAGVALSLLRSRPDAGTGTTVATAWLLGMLVGNGPMTLLGVTDPRTWSAADWADDVVPHVSYAAATTATLRAFDAR